MRTITGGGDPSLTQALPPSLSLPFRCTTWLVMGLLSLYQVGMRADVDCSNFVYMLDANGMCGYFHGVWLGWFLFLLLVYKKDLWILKGRLPCLLIVTFFLCHLSFCFCLTLFYQLNLR